MLVWTNHAITLLLSRDNHRYRDYCLTISLRGGCLYTCTCTMYIYSFPVGREHRFANKCLQIQHVSFLTRTFALNATYSIINVPCFYYQIINQSTESNWVIGVLRRFQHSFSYIKTIAACCMRRDMRSGCKCFQHWCTVPQTQVTNAPPSHIVLTTGHIQSWFYPFHVERLSRKQPVPFVTPLVWRERGPNPQPPHS